MLSFFTKTTATEPIEAVGRVLDGLFTSDKERLSKTAVLARVAQRPALVQAEINKIEAAHRSVFISGWRPFIGWVCGFALAYSFVMRDILTWIIAVYSPAIEAPPAIHMEELITVLMGLLGLGGYAHLKKSAAARAKRPPRGAPACDVLTRKKICLPA